MIVAAIIAIDSAEEIYQALLNNADFPAGVSEALANIFNPDHILGIAIAAITVVSLPLLHSIFTNHKLDISFTTPAESIADDIITKLNLLKEADQNTTTGQAQQAMVLYQS